MLAFSQQPAHNAVMEKSITRTLNPGSMQEAVIKINAGEKDAILRVNGYPYFLVPEELPDLAALQQLLRHERVEVYLAVVDMLTEMVK